MTAGSKHKTRGFAVGGFFLAVLVISAHAQSIGVARMLEQVGQLDRALDEYRFVLVNQPHNLSAYQGFRRVSVQLESYDSLVAVSKRLAKARPGEFQYVQGEIEGLFGLKRRKEALAECRRATEKWPAEIVQLAVMLEQWNEYGEAIGYLVRLRSNRGDELLHADRLVELYELQGRRVEAVREIVGIVSRQPDALAAYLGRLREYARKANSRSLLAELRRIKDPWARARAEAELYLGLGKQSEALKAARAGMNRDGLYGFAHECEDVGALNAALAIYQEQELCPDQARVLRKLGREKEALRVLAQDQSPEALFELAEIYRIEKKDYRAAAGAYERVLKLRPGHEAAVFGLGSAQVALGQLDQARVTLGRLKSPTERVLFLLARVLFYRQEFDSARYYVAELAQRFPQSFLVNDGLDLVLLTHGGEQAQELAQAMLESETGADEAAARRCQELAKGNDIVAEQACFLLARIARKQGKSKDALAILDGFIERFEQSPRQARARLEQAEIFSRDLKDENRYRQTLEELIVDFPGSPYAPVARSLLAEANRPAGPEIIH